MSHGFISELFTLELIIYPKIRPILISLILFASCSSGPRPYFSRLKGGYITHNPVQYGIRPISEGKSRATRKVTGGEAVVQTAKRYLGTPYRYGGETKNGMDCSGLVKRVFSEALSIQLPHNSRQISQLGRFVSLKNLKPGDVVIFGSPLGINHSGIHIGQDRFIHSSQKRGVRESSLNEPYWKKRWKMGRRLF